ncbi:hypothetical protein RB614_01455 [Phytohabitans sp. ZYX-F-186]|uniref:Uncharacterized protein n=1 Tax=Phytohabitans maris TaxID=3071409 RepID=A0ABU0ZA21_9ACTN|nr:hypothetical protein [Phytohabitans sp. ZYX-F-186]MDQ7903185.1 hypothetical protein [Phytohabitans sp. ZYX-F-186]
MVIRHRRHPSQTLELIALSAAAPSMFAIGVLPIALVAALVVADPMQLHLATNAAAHLHPWEYAMKVWEYSMKLLSHLHPW